MESNIENIIHNIDLKLLRIQRETLVEFNMIQNNTHLDGIIHLLDAIQDYLDEENERENNYEEEL